MKDQKIFQKIRSLYIDKGIDIDIIGRQRTLYSQENKELLELIKKSKPGGFKWSQYVRFAFEDQNERKFLTERIMKLAWSHQKKYSDYFEITTSDGTLVLPDKFSDYVRLRSMYEEYFTIYKKIIQHINFDYPKETFSDGFIRGKINWQETIKKNSTYFPLEFKTTNWIRKFETPENTLLLLYSYFLRSDCFYILNSKKEELNPAEKEILLLIIAGTNKIIQTFPFKNVTKKAHGYTKYERTSKMIQQLISETRQRIVNKKVRNSAYLEFENWINKYEQLDIKSILSGKRQFEINDLLNQDTLYEVWIFLEFWNYLKFVKKLNVILEKENDKQYLKFTLKGKSVKFHYGKQYSRYMPGIIDKNAQAWVRDVHPDFSVSIDEETVAVFDAKNYSPQPYYEEKREKINRIYDLLLELQNTKKRYQIEYEKLFENNIEKLQQYKKSLEEKTSNSEFSKLIKLNEKVTEIENLLSNYGIEKFSDYVNTDDLNKLSILKEVLDSYSTEKEKYKKILEEENEQIDGRITGAFHTILYYMLNLHVGYGALIFPKYAPSNDNDPYEFPKEGQICKFLNMNSKFEHYRMSKTLDEKSKKEKTITLEKMLGVIESQI